MTSRAHVCPRVHGDAGSAALIVPERTFHGAIAKLHLIHFPAITCDRATTVLLDCPEPRDGARLSRK